MPSGVELATAYISIVAETGGMRRQIAQALGTVDTEASKAGKNVGKNLFAGAGADAAKAGRDVGDRFSGAVKGALAAAGIAATAATVVAGIRQVFDAGLGFEKTANNFAALTRATTSEMEAMRAKARELGNDVAITGASASDALTAMTELAKGGFSIQQSMDGARGTLQLASAAQIDAASAATIQANALLAFGKSAEYASTAADVLANAANASSADIPDVASALQQAGAVANSFGVSMEDTVATIGLLANAGIKGSDAGTLLKSALLALTDQSNPAQGAIQELGLTVYDANGQFAGMEKLFGELQAASRSMTPEMYQAATTTLFGSDAARLAGVAMQQGAGGYDAMRVAVERQGAAAEVAAAQTQGLPGVVERLSNTAEAAKLQLFDLAKGPAETAGNWINNFVNQGLDALSGLTSGNVPDALAPLVDAGREALPTLKALGGVAADVVKTLGGVGLTAGAEALKAIGAVAGTVVVPALTMMSDLLEGNGTAVALVAAGFAAWKFLPGLLTSIGTPLQRIGSTAAGAVTTGLKTAGTTAVSTATALKAIATANQAVAGTAGLGAVQMGRFGSTIAQMGTHVPVLSRMQTAFLNGAAQAQNFGRTVGVAQATMVGFRSVGSSISNMFGGPWGAALTGATIGLVLWSQSVSEANQRAKTLEANARRVVDASKDIYTAFAESGGNVNDTVIAKVNDQVNALYDTIETKRKGASIADWFKSGATAVATLGFAASSFDASELQDGAEHTEAMIATMRELGITQQQVSSVIYSTNGAYEILEQRLQGAGEGGQRFLNYIRPLRDSFLANRDAADNLTPGVKTLEEAIGVLSDTTSTAEQKTNALKTALDTLAGKQPDVQEATAQYHETVQQVTQATQEAWDAAKGYGTALVNADGTVNTSTANGLKLYEALKQIKGATVDVAGAGGDLKAAFAGNDAQFAALAAAAGLSKDAVAAMAAAMGLVPERIETLMELNGASDAKEQVTLVKELLATVPPGTTITVDALTDPAKQALAEAGLKVEEFKAANGQTQLKITANGQAAIDELGRVRAEMDVLIAGTYSGRQAPGQDVANRGRLADEANARRNAGYLPYDPSVPRPPGRASGGPISGPGPKGKDSVLMYGAPGEHMWTDREVNAVGGHQNMYALRAAALAGAIPGWDQGGPISQDEWLKRMMQGQSGTELPNEGPLGYNLNRFGGVGRDRRLEVRGNFNPDMAIDTSTTSLAPSYGVDRNFGGGLPWFYSDIADSTTTDAKEQKSYRDVVLPRKQKFRNQDPFGGLLGYESGGEIMPGGGAYAAIDAAFNQSGQDYQYGTFDCSMYMSQIYAAMAGLPQGQRYFTTESDFEALGFKKGYKPGALNVGIRRGGGGPNSHMAGTLPNGINVENSSNGSLYGDGAAGADSFPIQYYYEPPMAGDMGAMQAQSMGQAGGGFNEMQELGAVLGGYGSASEASAAGAPLGGPSAAATPTRTEGYIPAGAGNTSVAGTSFLSGVIGMGGEAIKGAIDAAASAGSGAANAFAPGAGMAVGIGADIAKQGVDYGVKMAGIGVDALIEQLTPFGAPRWLSTDPTAFMPQARGMAAGTTTAETAVNQLQGQQSAVNPATTVHGQGMGAAPGPVAPATAPGMQPTPGMSAIGATQPMTGGTTVGGGTTTSTSQDWIKKIGIIPGLFDQGGVLEPGQLAINKTTKPEAVFTHNQLGDLMRPVPEGIPEPDPDFMGGGNTWNIYASNTDEAIRKWRNEDSLASMRYRGRSK